MKKDIADKKYEHRKMQIEKALEMGKKLLDTRKIIFDKEDDKRKFGKLLFEQDRNFQELTAVF